MNSKESFLILNILDDASMWFELEAARFCTCGACGGLFIDRYG